MSIRETLTKRLAQYFRKRGYRKGSNWGPFLMKVEGPGRFYRAFGFEVPRLVTGEVQVWNPKFIVIKWNSGRGLESVRCHTVDDVKQWANNYEWL